MLQDMVLAAVNEAIRSAQELAASKMNAAAGGLGRARRRSRPAGHVERNRSRGYPGSTMEAHPQAAPGPRARREEQRNALATQWRQLTRAATFVALLTSPAFFVILYQRNGWGFARRARRDVHRGDHVPRPGRRARAQADPVAVALRRRSADGRRGRASRSGALWYWRTKYRRLTYLLVFCTLVILTIFFDPVPQRRPDLA